MQSSTHIDEQVDTVPEASSVYQMEGITKLRITAATLFAIGISPCFGVHAMQSLQASFLLLDVLYIVPFMALLDQTVNWVWERQPVRFFAGGRVVWVLLALRGITWRQAFFIVFYQTGTHIIITTLNYFLYHRTLFKYIDGPQYHLAMEFSTV